MLACDPCDVWTQFLVFVKNRCSSTAFGNWLAPIQVIKTSHEEITLEIPNVFVKEYLLSNYKKDLCAFLPVTQQGEPSIKFVVNSPEKNSSEKNSSEKKSGERRDASSEKRLQGHAEDLPFGSPGGELYDSRYEVKLNNNYRFSTFIEGPNNQFVKSAAMGVATRPGQSYNPLFIHGGVGLGKTHILHSIGHHLREHHKDLRVQCITTEAFINDLVDSLRNKTIDKMKRFYRSSVGALLLDDIQFLQNRLNFEEEFCNMFEILINQGKLVVITSDKPPRELKLSERMIGRMEWGLVAHMSIPDLETRVAILQHKAEQKGLKIDSKVAFFIAEHINSNVRQLEGAINRLSAHCRLLDLNVTEELVERALGEMLHHSPNQKISVEQILKSVATIFQVRVVDLKGSTRTKEIALPRQVAMYLAKEMISESLMMLGASFGKTHSTILHACKNIEKKMASDQMLRRQIEMVRRNLI
jgi:chromosomal replication initiator protein